MNFSSTEIEGLWVWVANVAALIGLFQAVRYAQWKKLLADTLFQHLFLGATVFVTLLWQLKADITPLVSLHFLMSMTLTVMFRWPFALMASVLALIGLTWTGKAPVELLGVNIMTSAVVPVAASHFIYRWADKRLPDNFFVILFVGCFFGSALTALASGLSLMAVLWLGSTSYDFARISGEYFLFLPVILPPEAVVNGMLLSSLMVFKPDWVQGFDYKRYFDDK
ncbi:energy-coupling factor ABC transporter permease [Oceanospirillum sp.]|uniref:energy-coupling factor ABC transporter permease n=1 Tax=Oceanospirillum sp. TaxID=2021254 RepID=UPI003A8CC4E1